MNTRFSRLLCLSILSVLSVTSGTVYAQQELPATGTETELLAVLDSDAGLFEKAKACQRLAVIGTKNAVPVLAKLLADEQLSHYARFALEPIPDPAVDEALRASLTTLQGGPLVGVVNSIGMRRDAGSVEALTGLLTHADVAVSSAAAGALGRIAAPAAVETLQKNLAAAEPLRIAVADGCLTAADTLEKAKDLPAAMAIYDAMRQAELPKYLQIAALAGAIRSRGEQGVDLLVEQIKSSDKEFFAVGLSMAHLVPGQQVTDALLAELAKPTEQPTEPTKALTILKAEYGANNTWVDVTEQVIGAMAENGVSIRAGNELTGSDPVPSVVKTLRVTYTLSDEKKEVAVKEGEPFQVEGTVSRDPRLASIIAVLGERSDRSALPAIVKLVQAGPWDARMAAIRALAQVGDVSALPVLLEVAVQGQGSMSAAAIESLANLPDEKADVELLAQLDKSEGALRTALLQLVGRREIAERAGTPPPRLPPLPRAAPRGARGRVGRVGGYRTRPVSSGLGDGGVLDRGPSEGWTAGTRRGSGDFKARTVNAGPFSPVPRSWRFPAGPEGVSPRGQRRWSLEISPRAFRRPSQSPFFIPPARLASPSRRRRSRSSALRRAMDSRRTSRMNSLALP